MMATKDYIESATFTVTLGNLVAEEFNIGLDDYPIFDEAYRETLNAKIQRRYWFREIGLETPALFRFMLKRRMHEVMPYYNQLYKTALMEFDPFSNYDITTTHEGEGQRSDTRDNRHQETAQTSSAGDTRTTSEGRTVLSNTPQMQLSGRDDYATNLTDTTSASDATTNASDTSERELQELDKLEALTSENYVNHVSGVSGILKADAIMHFRDAIINVDVLVLDELAPLFMGLYSDYANYL